MPALLRTLSFIAFVSLLIFMTIVMLSQYGESPLMIGILVICGFTLPVALLWISLIRLRAGLEEYTRIARHLASGHTTLGLEENIERLAPALAKSLARIAVELERRERVYEEHRAATHQILNGIGEGVLAIDLDRRVRLANHRAMELFHFDETVTGREYLEVVRNAQLVSAFDRAFRGSASHARASFTVRGEERQIEMRVFPLRSGDVAAVALFIDVTEFEKLQAVRREFMADFHHEVRTPLAGIRLAIESLESPTLTQTQTEHLQKIVTRQVARLERLVQEVGQLNEIESGELVLYREPTELKSLLADVAEEWSEAASQRGIQITVEGTERETLLDATKIQQVLSNLVDNAIKHSGAKTIRLLVNGEGEGVVVSVVDDGEGIAAEEQEKIFHRFYRVDKSRSGASEGTGLGLAIAKHLMRRHGGSITVESEPGRGASFSLHFPA
jgi:two-component system phosphate regulon sensor histidine kinase PhoR